MASTSRHGNVEEYPGKAVNRDLWLAMLTGICTSFDAVNCKAMKVVGGEAVMPPTEEERVRLGLHGLTMGPLNPRDICARTGIALYAYSDVIVNGGPSDYTPAQKGESDRLHLRNRQYRRRQVTV